MGTASKKASILTAAVGVNRAPWVMRRAPAVASTYNTLNMKSAPAKIKNAKIQADIDNIKIPPKKG
jgi:hypothetical protein